MGESDDDLLSRTGVHYHWRGLVSLSCSGWEGVVPRRYGRQTITCTVRRIVCPHERQREEVCCWCVIVLFAQFALLYCKVIGSSLTGN